MQDLGVDKADMFQTNDLFEKKDVANVVHTIYAISRAVRSLGVILPQDMISHFYMFSIFRPPKVDGPDQPLAKTAMLFVSIRRWLHAAK